MCLEQLWLQEDVEEMWWGRSRCAKFLGEGCEREEGAGGDCEKVNTVGIEKDEDRGGEEMGREAEVQSQKI